METSLILPLLLWLIASVILLFMGRIAIGIRLIPIILCALMLLFWYTEISAAVETLRAGKADILGFVQDGLRSGLLAMVWVWPIGLLPLFFSREGSASGRTVLILLLFTLVCWVSYLVFGFYHPGKN